MNRAGMRRVPADHFEPDGDVDAKAQRQLRGQLEQIDYIAYTANRSFLSTALGRADAEKFERVARATALARTQWVAAALTATDGDRAPSQEQIHKLTHLRVAYEELTEVYDAMRRLVERGYLPYAAADPQGG
jgi:hypothetical protein